MDVHYFMFFILSSFICLLFIIQNTLFVMDRKLPHDGVYDDRSKASSAINRCHATMMLFQLYCTTIYNSNTTLSTRSYCGRRGPDTRGRRTSEISTTTGGAKVVAAAGAAAAAAAAAAVWWSWWRSPIPAGNGRGDWKGTSTSLYWGGEWHRSSNSLDQKLLGEGEPWFRGEEDQGYLHLQREGNSSSSSSSSTSTSSTSSVVVFVEVPRPKRG